MIRIDIPGLAALELAHLVLDHNGTLARDGRLLPDVAPRLERLAGQLAIHVVTGDTFGTAREQLAGLPCDVTVLPSENQAQAKRDFVTRLGRERTACIGNGRNDRLMLEDAALGIAVVGPEGAAGPALAAADAVAGDIRDALDLLLHPQRLVATLRG